MINHTTQLLAKDGTWLTTLHNYWLKDGHMIKPHYTTIGSGWHMINHKYTTIG